jgi:predicted YcjX-like family ATPase
VNPNPDIRWKQRFQNFDRAFVLLRDAMENGPSALNPLEQAVEAIHTRYLTGIERLHDFMQREAMK